MHPSITAMTLEERSDERDHSDEQERKRSPGALDHIYKEKDEKGSDCLDRKRPTQTRLGHERTQGGWIESATQDLLQGDCDRQHAACKPSCCDLRNRPFFDASDTTATIRQQESLCKEVARDDEAKDDREEIGRDQEQGYSLRKVERAKRANQRRMKNASTKRPMTR